MKKKPAILYVIIIILSFIIFYEFFIFSASIDEKDQDKKINSKETIIIEHAPVVQPIIPNEVYFCGERVPIELFDVREALDKELVINTYRHSTTIMYLKRANRYFPEIERLLKQHNIPDDMKYLCVAESGLDHVVSPAGAAGYWQFLSQTAREYGMEVNKSIDERYHANFSLVAATKYLQDSYDRFGSWALAAAAYNMGNRGVKREISEQRVNNYWDLHLNSETARYVYRIIALKIIMSNPKDYGFNISDEYLYKEIETYEVIVDTTITDLVEFAFQHGTNYKMIRYLNPWIRGNGLPNKSRKEYVLRIPTNNTRPFDFPEKEVEEETQIEQ
jgi:membrane-bound lytic murein transglycosylase D